MAKDPYSVLGVKKNATENDIKSAFRRLAKQHHPDKAGADPKAKQKAQEKFSQITQAYEVIGDQATRAKFDAGQIDAEGKEKADFGGFGGFGGDPFGRSSQARSGFGGSNFSGGINPEDILKSMFGDMGGDTHSRARPNARPNARQGARPDARHSNPRQHAHSQPEIEPTKARLTATLAQLISGEKINATLPDGRRLNVNVPKGTKHGEVIRLKGQGMSDQFGQVSDLHLTLHIKADKCWSARESDIFGSFDVPLAIAVQGGKVNVNTPNGTIAIKIPAWSDSGKTFRLRDKGLYQKNNASERGDMILTMRIVLPTQRPEALATLLKRLDEQK